LRQQVLVQCGVSDLDDLLHQLHTHRIETISEPDEGPQHHPSWYNVTYPYLATSRGASCVAEPVERESLHHELAEARERVNFRHGVQEGRADGVHALQIR